MPITLDLNIALDSEISVDYAMYHFCCGQIFRAKLKSPAVSFTPGVIMNNLERLSSGRLSLPVN